MSPKWHPSNPFSQIFGTPTALLLQHERNWVHSRCGDGGRNEPQPDNGVNDEHELEWRLPRELAVNAGLDRRGQFADKTSRASERAVLSRGREPGTLFDSNSFYGCFFLVPLILVTLFFELAFINNEHANDTKFKYVVFLFKQGCGSKKRDGQRGKGEHGRIERTIGH